MIKRVSDSRYATHRCAIVGARFFGSPNNEKKEEILSCSEKCLGNACHFMYTFGLGESSEAIDPSLKAARDWRRISRNYASRRDSRQTFTRNIANGARVILEKSVTIWMQKWDRKKWPNRKKGEKEHHTQWEKGRLKKTFGAILTTCFAYVEHTHWMDRQPNNISNDTTKPDPKSTSAKNTQPTLVDNRQCFKEIIQSRFVKAEIDLGIKTMIRGTNELGN